MRCNEKIWQFDFAVTELYEKYEQMINLILHVIVLLKINQNKEHNVQGGKKGFHDLQWVPNYQCDAFLGPD